MIGSQSLKVGTFSRHLVNRNQKIKHFRKAVVAGLMLTSMVDMFSLLVIFLLQSFSNAPEVVSLTRDLKLPAAVSGMQVKDSPVVSVSRDEVYVDKAKIGSTNDLLTEAGPLLKRLDELKTAWGRKNPEGKWLGEIHLQADRDIPSTVVSQFMSMMISQGYGSIQLAVVAGK